MKTLIFGLLLIACGKQPEVDRKGPSPSPTPSPAATSSSWSDISPKGGFFPAMIFHPSTNGVVWASADDGGGLFKSTDYGASWTAVTAAGINQSSYSMAFDPTDSNIIFAPNHFGRGMLRSTDGGVTWTSSQAGLPLTSNDNQLVFDIVINPTNHNIVMVATHNGLYRSTDNGINFSVVAATGLTGNNKFSALAYRSDGALFAGKSDGSFSFSTNNGDSFTEAIAPTGTAIDAIVFSTNWLYLGYKSAAIYRMNPSTLANTLINNPANAGSILNSNRLRIAVKSGGSSTTDLVYVGSSGLSTYASNRYGLFKSTDSGSTFAPAMTGMTGNFIMSIAIAPNDSNRVVVGSGVVKGIHYSSDAGANWTQVTANLTATGGIGLAQNPSNKNHLLSSYSAGGGFTANFESTNGGATWTTFADPSTDDGVFAFDIDPNNSSIILAGMYTKGVWRSTSGSGGPWTQIVTSSTNRVDRFVRDNVNRSTVYAVFPTGGTSQSLYVSTNSGSSFAPKTLVAYSIAAHPTNGNEAIAVNGSDAYATTNNFTTTSSLGLSGFAGAEGGFTAIAYNSSNASEVIVGGASGGIYKTTNYNSSGAGVTWTKLTPPITAILIRDVLVVTRNGKSVYYVTTFGGQTSFSATSTIGFYRSLDGGTTWSLKTSGLYPCTIGWRLIPDVYSPTTSFLSGLWGGGVFKFSDNE